MTFADTSVTLNEKELVGLYIQLKEREFQLDTALTTLLTRIEKYLYSRLTVEEIENINLFYKRME